MARKARIIGKIIAGGIVLLPVIATILIVKAGRTGPMTLTLRSITTNESGGLSYVFEFENEGYDCVARGRVSLEDTSGTWSSVPYGSLALGGKDRLDTTVSLGEKATFTFEYPVVALWAPSPGQYVRWKPEIQCERMNPPRPIQRLEQLNKAVQLKTGLPLLVQVEMGRAVSTTPLSFPEPVHGGSNIVITPRPPRPASPYAATRRQTDVSKK